MNGVHFDDVFPGGKAFLPVIHVKDVHQSLDQAAIAIDNGADGIFLIGHGMHHDELVDIYMATRRHFPGAWIGINCLDMIPELLATLPGDVNGIWTDRSGIDDDMDLARSYAVAFEDTGFEGLYFGGVAFKYQPQPVDVARATKMASGYMDVVTTSGRGTGIAASKEKVAIMAGALACTPARLAIASGITVENVVNYAGVDCFLVATGISKDFHHLDPGRVGVLSGKIHGSGVHGR